MKFGKYIIYRRDSLSLIFVRPRQNGGKPITRAGLVNPITIRRRNSLNKKNDVIFMAQSIEVL